MAQNYSVFAKTFVKQIKTGITKENINLFASLATAIATSLAAYFSYQAVQASRVEAAYAREYAFSSEKRFMIGKLKATAISLKQARQMYQQYRSSCCSGWDTSKTGDPELALRYGQNTLNAANNFLTVLIETGPYNLAEMDYHVQEINKWIAVLPHSQNDASSYYDIEIDNLIYKLNTQYKNLTTKGLP